MSLSDDYKEKADAAKARAEICLSAYNSALSGSTALDKINAKYWKEQYDNNISDYKSFMSRYYYYMEEK